MLMQANKGNLIQQYWKNAKVSDQALRSLKKKIPRRRLFLACLFKGMRLELNSTMAGGFPRRIPDLACWTDSARLSVQSFSAVLIQSRAPGIIYCALFKLSLQYYKSFSFMSFVSLSDTSSPLIVVPYSFLILRGFKVFSRFFPYTRWLLEYRKVSTSLLELREL